MTQRDIHIRTCHLCEAMCGLEVHVEDDEVKLIRPNRDDVWSKGYICPKGTTLGHLHHDPDRLRVPLIRNAMRRACGGHLGRGVLPCAELMAGVIEEHGKEAVTIYIGNPAAHNYSISRYTGLLMGLADLPGPSLLGRHRRPVAEEPDLLDDVRPPVADPRARHPEHAVPRRAGANPHASQGSLVACADILGELDRVRERARSW
ncbi:MAG: hypothetical protein R2695_06950 [Acidimicrobiales bacterium]